MTADLRALARQWQAAGRPAVVVEVVASRGSVPREAGTRMLVAADAVAGTIGGGHLEWQAIRQAREQLGHAPGHAGQPSHQHVALGPTLGQCCGGALDLRYTPLAMAEPAAWPATPPRFTLQLYGAGHVGRAIVRLLTDLPCQVQWIDEREAEFPSGPSGPSGPSDLSDPSATLPQHIQRVCVEPVQAEVAAAPPGAFFLVLTHSHDLDMALAQAILQRGDFGWFGLIGSATKRARFESRLRQRGISDALLQRMVCPIGLPGITGKEPELIALAVVAQLLQHAG